MASAGGRRSRRVFASAPAENCLRGGGLEEEEESESAKFWLGIWAPAGGIPPWWAATSWAWACAREDGLCGE